MISVFTPPVVKKVTLAGTVRHIAYDEIGDLWVPLSGRYLPVLDNPVIFGIYGFMYGQTTIDDVSHFKLPVFNSTVGGATSTFVRPRNRNNSGGRNTGRNINDIIPATARAHSHYGSSSYDGDHSHPSITGSRLLLIVQALQVIGEYNPLQFSLSNSLSVPHGSHAHSGSPAGPMVLDQAHTGNEVEPKGYASILCIHRG